MIVPLCRCNKCLTLMIDNNSQTGSHKFQVPSGLLPENTFNEELGTYECPECGSDEYLSDVGCVINHKKVVIDEMDEISILNELLKWIEKGIQDAKRNWDFKSKKMFIHFREFINKELDDKYR